MKRFLYCAFAVLLWTGVADCVYAQVEADLNSFIEVSGYAEKEVAPDIFYMRIVLDESDSKGKVDITAQQNDMVAALKNLGVDTEKQLTRLSLSSDFYNKKTNLASASFQLKLFTAEDVAAVWRKLDGMGISDVTFVKAENSRIDEVVEEVRRSAACDAKKQAESLASALDQKIGKCFYMYCNSSRPAALYQQPMMLKSSIRPASLDSLPNSDISDSVEFGNIKVSASVSAKFVLF